MNTENMVQLLTWDSEFFGLRVASINGNKLSKEEDLEIQEWCRDNRIDCLCFLAESSDARTIRVAEESGFHFVDIRITLDLTIAAMPSVWKPQSASIRLADVTDIPALRPIAACNHLGSRFYSDGRFPRERCDELYATWIEKSCTGFAEAVLVPVTDGEAVGYLSCHLRDTGIGQIGLVGIARPFRGKGLGQQLLDESLCWFAAAGVSQVAVVTQGSNISAQRLYQGSGFMTKSVQVWYHKWFS